MRILPVVPLFFVMLGCGSGTEPAKSSAESGDNQTQQQKVVTSEKQAASSAAKTPDVVMVKKQMTPDQVALGDPVVNSVGMLLVPIPAGEFQMGSPDSDCDALHDEKPQHPVKITKPFYLGVYEVTQGQYEKVMGGRPWYGENFVKDGPDFPAVYVTWDDAVEFCRKLSKQEGVEYRLPTEAEWEYACRAGTSTVYSFGDNASKLGQYAWCVKNTYDVGEGYAHRIGRKLPNSWALYDMHGNVWEWCQDWYAPYDTEKTVSDPAGPAQGDGRLLRGGAFIFYPRVVRSAYRLIYHPVSRVSGVVGFRVARTFSPKRSLSVSISMNFSSPSGETLARSTSQQRPHVELLW